MRDSPFHLQIDVKMVERLTALSPSNFFLQNSHQLLLRCGTVCRKVAGQWLSLPGHFYGCLGGYFSKFSKHRRLSLGGQSCVRHFYLVVYAARHFGSLLSLAGNFDGLQSFAGYF